jgi:hypothetical protein
MIVKKTKQFGNFKKGINLYIPKRMQISSNIFTQICVSGAGFNAANGTYIYSQAKGYWIRNSSFEWRVGYNADTSQARWGISAWFMNGTIFVGEYYYNNTPLATSENPPQTEWIVPSNFDNPPAPTIAYAAC